MQSGAPSAADFDLADLDFELEPDHVPICDPTLQQDQSAGSACSSCVDTKGTPVDMPEHLVPIRLSTSNINQKSTNTWKDCTHYLVEQFRNKVYRGASGKPVNAQAARNHILKELRGKHVYDPQADKLWLIEAA